MILILLHLEHDVWSHKQLLNVVSHTKIETDTLLEIINSGEWVDVMRELVPHDKNFILGGLIEIEIGKHQTGVGD